MKIVTHNGRFHADDCFAVAFLRLVFGKDIEIVRTRDETLMANADIVVDVGQICDSKQRRFDHHQTGGAGIRHNGIPYAGFGLVWKEFGENYCGSKDVAKNIDERLVQQIDAMDNGISIYNPVFDGVYPYLIADAISSFMPTWKEGEQLLDSRFMEAVIYAEKVLEREIIKEKDKEEAKNEIISLYNSSSDKKIFVIPDQLRFEDETIMSALSFTEEPLIFIKKSDGEDKWKAKAFKKGKFTFENRVLFPESWAGLKGLKLDEAAKVSGADFCHNKRFMCTANSKETVIKMAKIAISESEKHNSSSSGLESKH